MICYRQAILKDINFDLRRATVLVSAAKKLPCPM